MNRRFSISDADVITARPLEVQERAKLEAEVAELAEPGRGNLPPGQVTDRRSDCTHWWHDL